jgi:iron(III) transport system substrate-binding protein
VRSNPRRGLRAWSTLATVAVGLSLVACGDDDDDAGASATTAAAAAADTTAAGTATTAGDATATTAGGSDTTAGETMGTDTVGTGTPGSAAPDDPDLVAAATEEGQVTIYSSQGLDALEQMASNFEAKYPGIDVEVVRGIDSDLAPKVEAENQTGQGIADVYVNASLSWVVDHAEQGWFLPVEGPELTGQGAYDAEQYVHDGNYFEVGAAVLTFAWNTELYEAGVTDYPDLLDPALQGQMGVIEPTAPSIVDFYLWLEETYGEEYVEQLAALEPRIYPSSLPIGEALAAGEIAATPYAAPQTLVPLADQGAPVEFGIGPQGAWGARFFGVVLTSAPNPNAGQLLANYMVTAEAQEVLQATGGSVLPDIPGTLITNAETREQDLSKLTPEAVAAYQEKWNGLFR